MLGWLLPVAVALVAAPAAEAASPGLDLRQPLTAGTRPHHAPGLPSAPPTPEALAASVRQASGLTLAQVTVRNVCPAPGPGQAACAAQALVLRSDHRLVHPHVVPRPTFTQVFPRHRDRGRASVSPAAGMTSSSSSPPVAGTPAYIQQAYDLTYLSQTAGGSDTVAVVDAGGDPHAAADLATYRSTYGLPACTVANGCFTEVNQSGGSSPLPASAGSDWVEEESLDLDAISALCPNCHIVMVQANSSAITDLDAGIAAAESLGANQISNSYGSPSTSPVGVGSFPGATILAATGDHGYAGAGQAQYPAAFPGVTAVGGTTLSAAADGTSLRGYSESAWSLNSSVTGWGGGSGCDLSEPKPSYQADTGCTGRAYSDVSADGDPATGIRVYDAGDGGWLQMGGTSLASPLVAAYEGLTAVTGTTAQWAYSDSALLNDPTTGSAGSCATGIAYICNAGTGYDGPTGIGSISGDIVTGAPGVGGPSVGGGSNNTYTQAAGTTTANLAGGVYPNGLDTSYVWQYGTTTAYGQQTSSTDIGSGTAPVAAPASLSGLTPETTYHYRLVASNGDGTDYGYDYTLTTGPATNVAPVNSIVPSISGSALQGQTLTAANGSWSPTPTSYAYQWQRCNSAGAACSAITGATSGSYAVATGDIGDDIEMTVTATNSFGASAATSAVVGPVGSGAPVDTTLPSISGHPDQGQVLSAVSTWNPVGTGYTYQWQSSSDGGTTWGNITGATSATYPLTSTDLGNELRLTVTASNTYGHAAATSAAVGPVQADAPINAGAPSVTGTPQRTGTLTATAGSWTGAGNSISYQWQRSSDGSTWLDIPNATGATYNLALADEGDTVRVQVTASNTSGVSSAPSAPTGIIAPYPPANTVAPTVSGIAERGVTLNATEGTWTGPDLVYTYQWQRDAGEGYVNISGATAAGYTLGIPDEGATVRVVVTAADPDSAISQASAATATVTDASPVNQTAPTVSGTAQRGDTLTATAGTWAGIGNAYSFQWERSADGTAWTDIAGATTAAYTVVSADEGDQLRVVVSAVNPDGTAATPSAATVAATTAPPVATVAPTIAGSAQRGLSLTGARGTWSGAGNAYTYQWQSSADGSTWTNIAGATGLSYTVAVADEGDYLRLGVTATNPDATVTAASAPAGLAVATPAVNTTLPTLAGTPVRSDTLNATVGAWGGVGNVYTCQWQRSADNGVSWTDIAGATAWSYTVAVADEGDLLRALVTATNADGTVAQPSAATTPAASARPVDTSSPAISGTAVRGNTLTSTQGTWTGLGNAYSDQWQRSADNGTTWTSIAGATGSSYPLAVADEGDTVRLVVTAVNPDATVSAATAASATVASAVPANTVPPAISGPAQRGLTLASAAGTWNGNGNTYTYQWQRSAGGATWTNITGATNSTYTMAVADEGDTVRLVLTATNPDGAASADSAPSATVAAAPPVDTVLPTITGAAQRGGTLIASTGTWLGVGDADAFQWQHSTDGGTTWTNIAGATSASYAIGVVDESTEIRVQVTATNVDGSSAAESTASAAVPVAAPVNTVAPTVSGTAQRGFLLNATPGTWGGIGNSLGYQWQRSADSGTTWTDIPGATATTYTLTVADEGAIVRVRVTAANLDGTLSAPSLATAVIGSSAPVNTTSPSFQGIARRGNTLSAASGVWSGPGNTVTVQWQRSADGGATWSNIAGATSSGYTVAVADEGDTLRLLVTATNPDGAASAATAASATVTGAPPINTAAPTVSGTAERTDTLSATAGSWTGPGNSVTYQWQRTSDSGTTWTAISGATAASYTLAVADEGAQVRVLVTATNPDGSVSAGSAPTASVQAAPPVSTQLPVVAGPPRLGATLSAGSGTWSPAGATYSYTWQRGDPADGYTNIAGATSATYTAVSADVGEHIRVIVTATNPDGNTSAISLPTQTVAQAPVSLTAPAAPAGTLQDGSTLTPDTGSWDSAVTYAYQWERCPGTATGISANCTPIGNRVTYTLTAGDIGDTVGVTITATSAGGTTVVNSPVTGVVVGQPLSNTTAPSISGNPQVPNTLSANPGSWSVALSSATYEWDRCGADGVTGCATIIAGTAHYTLTAADAGHTIVLIADVTSPGRAGSAQSPPLTVQTQPLPEATIMPTVSGTATRTFTLGATGGSWTNSPTGLTYQWERCNASGAGCTAIPGATQLTYQLAAADEGFRVTVAVTATNTSGAGTAAATPSAVVAGLPPVNTHDPALSSLAVQQSVPVGAAGAAWQATSDTTYRTQWDRCNSSGASCSPIGGAAASGYTPIAADVGHTLVAVITATNVDGSVASASSASDIVLPAAPRWRDLPILDATNGDVGGVLTITPGVWTGPVVTTDTTQVMRCTNACVSVSSAASYTAATADIGAILRVREIAGNAGGATVVWSAGYVGPVASASSASAVLVDGHAVLRNDDGAPLAVARISSSATESAQAMVAGAAAPAAARNGAPVARSITVRRAARVRGTLRAWACPVGTGPDRAPLPCTRQVSFRGGAVRVELPAKMTGRIRIVVVRRGLSA